MHGLSWKRQRGTVVQIENSTLDLCRDAQPTKKYVELEIHNLRK